MLQKFGAIQYMIVELEYICVTIQQENLMVEKSTDHHFDILNVEAILQVDKCLHYIFKMYQNKCKLILLFDLIFDSV